MPVRCAMQLRCRVPSPVQRPYWVVLRTMADERTSQLARVGMAARHGRRGSGIQQHWRSDYVFIGHIRRPRSKKPTRRPPRRRFFASVPTMANKYGQSGRYERLPTDQTHATGKAARLIPAWNGLRAWGDPTNRETGPCRFAAARTNKKMGRHPYRCRPIWQRGESTLELIQELMLTRCLRRPSTTSGSIRP